MNQSKRLGILGGSFDPVHLGHIALAQSAFDDGRVDEIVFVPAAQASMRDAPVRAASVHRLKMLEIAASKLPFPHSACTFELDRGGISYAVDTVKFLSEKYPQKRLRWILGGDHIAKLHGWKDIDAIAKLADFICARRDGFDADTSKLPPSLHFEFFAFAPLPHSSTEIRARLARGEKNLKMLDPDVESYIFKNKLYNT